LANPIGVVLRRNPEIRGGRFFETFKLCRHFRNGFDPACRLIRIRDRNRRGLSSKTLTIGHVTSRADHDQKSRGDQQSGRSNHRFNHRDGCAKLVAHASPVAPQSRSSNWKIVVSPAPESPTASATISLCAAAIANNPGALGNRAMPGSRNRPPQR
jgi:hypothetical protein